MRRANRKLVPHRAQLPDPSGHPRIVGERYRVLATVADDESPVCCRNVGICLKRPCEKSECQVFAFAIAVWSA